MKKLLAITAAVVLLASTSPLAAFTLVERGSSFIHSRDAPAGRALRTGP